jgi:hypothetical protein
MAKLHLQYDELVEKNNNLRFVLIQTVKTLQNTERLYLEDVVHKFFERESLDYNFMEAKTEQKKWSADDPGGTGNYPGSPKNKVMF